MFKKLLVGLISVILIGFVIYGCGKVVEETRPSGTGSLIGKVTLIGQTSGNWGDVTISVTGTTTTAASNGNGYFSILSVPTADRAIVTFSKTGYVSTSKIVAIKPGVESYVEANLAPIGTTRSLNAATGGTVSH